MLWNGKVIGCFLGAMLGGPWGALIGIALGYAFDAGWLDTLIERAGFSKVVSQQANVQQIFFDSTFTLMGYLSKSDGRVTEAEIQTAKKIMIRLNLAPAMQKEAAQLFNAGKKPGFEVNFALEQLKKACRHRPSLLHTFIEILFQIAYADEHPISAKKYETLKDLCRRLGIVGLNFEQFEQRYRVERNYERDQRQPYRNPQVHLSDAYKILEINTSATNAEVKRAYRRKMNKNHPDKLISKGLPPEMIKIATEKTQQIKDAYETVKRARGL